VTRDFIKSEPEVAAEQTIWPFRDKLMANNGLTNMRIHSFCSDRVDGRSLAEVAQSFVERQLSFQKSFSGANPLTDFQAHPILSTLACSIAVNTDRHAC
jgi:hypothetical protein